MLVFGRDSLIPCMYVDCFSFWEGVKIKPIRAHLYLAKFLALQRLEQWIWVVETLVCSVSDSKWEIYFKTNLLGQVFLYVIFVLHHDRAILWNLLFIVSKRGIHGILVFSFCSVVPIRYFFFALSTEPTIWYCVSNILFFL